MFGYVRPLRPELKCRDFDRYGMFYCGLCRALRRGYGIVAPLFLSYDFTFLAALLWDPDLPVTPCRGRCTARPWRRKNMCPECPALDLAAAECVVLSWWKLRDGVKDGRGLKKLGAGLLSGLLYPAYRRARRVCPVFADTVERCLGELGELERENCPSLDRPADAFARLLQAAVPEEDPRSRVSGQLLYHLGRWIYLADARDDLQEDLALGSYNPVAARYGPEGDDGALALTMGLSLDRMGAALQLGDWGAQMPLLENIVYLGLPAVQRCVLDGSWRQMRRQRFYRD